MAGVGDPGTRAPLLPSTHRSLRARVCVQLQRLPAHWGRVVELGEGAEAVGEGDHLVVDHRRARPNKARSAKALHRLRRCSHARESQTGLAPRTRARAGRPHQQDRADGVSLCSGGSGFRRLPHGGQVGVEGGCSGPLLLPVLVPLRRRPLFLLAALALPATAALLARRGRVLDRLAHAAHLRGCRMLHLLPHGQQVVEIPAAPRRESARAGPRQAWRRIAHQRAVSCSRGANSSRVKPSRMYSSMRGTIWPWAQKETQRGSGQG